MVLQNFSIHILLYLELDKLELFDVPELLPLGLNSLPWIQNIVRLTTTTKPLGKSKARAHTEVSYYVSSLIEYCTDPDIILSIILGERHYLLGDTYEFDIDHLVDVQHKECPLNKLCRKLLNNFIEINNSMGIKPKLKSKKAARELMEQMPMSMIFERLLAYELKHIKAHHSEDQRPAVRHLSGKTTMQRNTAACCLIQDMGPVAPYLLLAANAVGIARLVAGVMLRARRLGRRRGQT